MKIRPSRAGVGRARAAELASKKRACALSVVEPINHFPARVEKVPEPRGFGRCFVSLIMLHAFKRATVNNRVIVFHFFDLLSLMVIV